MPEPSTREPVWKRENLTLPPTEPGETFTLADIGSESGGTAVSAVREAFADTWGEVALVLENEFGVLVTYAYLDGDPIYLDHIPDEAFDEERYGIQTNGIRYSYDFIRALDATPFVAVVPWEQTRFTEVVAEEVWYP
jgi:hypothetical protein